MPGAAEGKRVADALREDERPALVLWADSDPVLPVSVGERVSSQLDFPPPRPIANASHFLQEDAGPEIGAIIADWLGLIGRAQSARVRVLGLAAVRGGAGRRPRPR